MRLLLILLLAPLFSLSQEIDKSEFDKFDSLYKVTTKDRMLSNSMNDLNNMLFAKVGRYVSVKKKKAFTDNITVYILNLASETYSLDGSSSVKILFEDDTVKEYKNEGKYTVYGVDDAATQLFTIKAGDPLFTKDIKSIRFTHSKGNIDLDVTNNSLIKDMLVLVNKEVVK